MRNIVIRAVLLATLICGAAVPQAKAQALLVATGSVWKYLDTGVSLDAQAWKTLAFNDSTWAMGPAQLGYGDGDEATVLSYGADANNKFITTYFRRTFVVTNPAAFNVLNMRVLRDDGIIVYINGNEIWRDAMPAGAVTSATLAPAAVADDGLTWQPFTTNGAPLITGTNIIAVEIHQSAGNSSDISFDLELRGTNSPPTISLTSPSNGAMLNAGASVTVTANAQDAEGIASVEFFQNGLSLGADSLAPFSITVNSVAEGSYTYTATVTDSDGLTANSAPVSITVSDPTPPRLVSASAISNQVTVNFSKRVVPPSATTSGNYGINNGVVINSAAFSGSPGSNAIVLTTSAALSVGVNYTLTVNNVQDALGQSIASNSQTNFSAMSFVAGDVGSPGQAGSTTPSGNGFNIVGGGTNIFGIADQFHFNYQQFPGDFDVKVRLQSLSLSDTWAKAGLMARENLTAGSRYAASFATPSVSGCFFQYRSLTSNQTTNQGSFPVTYPNTWLRLKRVGSVFTGYAGPDGNSWATLGSLTLSPGPVSPMFVGMAVTGDSASQTASAQFRDFDNVTGTPSTVSPALVREPMGASSRRTGLAISEIMYHPRTLPAYPSNSLEFIEIYNSQAFDEKIGGYRISGSVDYTFASNTVIKSGAYLVVAREPAFVQSYYAITGVLGPWIGATTNSLPGGSGNVRLRNRQGAVLLEVPYEGGNPWPIAADGAGHSLALARPTYGESDPRAWAASDSIDGSPGRAEPFSAERLAPVVINEFLAHTDLPLVDYVELYNHSTSPIDLSGAYLTDEADTNKFRIPNGTTIGATGFVYFTETTLGFALSSAGERIYLVNSNQTRVIDAIDFEAQANGRSSGRYPDGASTFYPLAARTPGAANSGPWQAPIVINEIMHSPISGNGDDEYIELYNRSSNAVNIGHWKFTAGISFTVPTNTIIASNGYLVIARSMTNLLAHYGNLNSGNTRGDFGGSLSGNGERLALSMPDQIITTNTNTMVITTNIIYIVENEVTYGKGGRWGNWAAGGGSSLELVDPNSDNRQPANWADSDETTKSQWTSYEFTGSLGETLGSPVNDELLIFLLGVGECLIDEVEVHNGAGANLVTNPGFESDLTGWVVQGSHDFSTIENVGFAGNKSLHLRAASRGDNGPNRVRTTPLSTAASGIITVRAKARWLRGWPEVLFRIHGGSAEAVGRMAVPFNLGTPGSPNSRRIADAGPAIFEVNHTPALPQAGEPVVVTCRALDPDGISTLNVRFRVDAGNTVITPALFTSLAMRDDGIGGDAIPGDGIYSATLTGQPANGTISFYIEAVDSRGATNRFPQDVFPPSGLPRCFPNDAIARECVVRWGDTMMPGAFASYHLWLTYANSNRWGSRTPQLNNAPLDGTFVYNNYRVVYDALPLYAGSPWHRGAMTGGPSGTYRVDYVQNFPPDDLMLGNTDFVLNNPGNPDSPGANTSDTSAQAEQTSYIVFNEIGLVYNHRRYVHHFVNGSQRSVTGNRPGNFIFEDSQQPNGDMIAEWFPDDTSGNLYKIEDWFEFPDNGFDFTANNDADLMRRTITVNSTNTLYTAPLRFMFRARSVGSGESANDYTNIFSLVDAISPNATYGPSGASNAAPVPDPATLNSLADVDQWMRIFAVQHTIGNWDSYGYRRGKNDYTYKPENGRFQQMTWDIDFTVGVGGDGTSQSLFDIGTAADGDRRVVGMWNTPVFVRSYWRALQDIVNGPLNNSFIDPILDAKYNALRANNVNVDIATVNTIKTFFTGRRTFILSELAKVTPGFALFGASTITTSNSLVAINGGASVTVQDITISINGGTPVIWPVNWTGTGQYNSTNFTLRLVLNPGTNSVAIQGLDRLGQPVAGTARTVTIVYEGTAANPIGSLGFSEIMYSAAAPNAGYVEIYNNSDSNFDLSGWRINGLDYTFPNGAFITNRQFLVLAQNRAGYNTAYGTTTPALDAFNGNLDLDGETLTLLKAGTNGVADIVVDKVRYENRLPWPISGATGAALQLIDPAVDNSRSSAWAAGGAWINVTKTASVTTLTNMLLWLTTAGNCFVDDISIVATNEGSTNIVLNGDFESDLSGPWIIPAIYSGSYITNGISHSGNSSLFISGSAGGSGLNVIQQWLGTRSITNATTCTLSYWIRFNSSAVTVNGRTLPGSSFITAATVQNIVGTPGTNNIFAAALPAYEPLWLNELQAENPSGISDNFGEKEPWIELYNGGTNTLSLENYYLANNYTTNLTQWQFPAGSSIAPGAFRIIWADGEPGETSGTNIHTSFRLNSTTGSVALVRLVANTPQITDYLTYSGLGAGLSYGDYPDGQPFNRVIMQKTTPRGTNIANDVSVFINEWMAANTNSVSDPADGHFDDWFELYNGGTNTVDLGGYYLTDNLASRKQYQVPANGQYIIAPHGFLLVWADGENSQNASGRDLHVSFQLSKGGESIGLFAPDGQTPIDTVSFGPQTDDVSQGRFADGASNIVFFPSTATPGEPNKLGNANTAPQLDPIPSRVIRLTQAVSFNAHGTDPDAGQSLTYTLAPGAAMGASITSGGAFNWIPTPAQTPSTNQFIVTVTDNGSPQLSASQSFTVIVLPQPTADIANAGGGMVAISFDTIPGKTYRVEYKNNLQDSMWTPLTPNTIVNNTTFTVNDTIGAQMQRFYQIVEVN